MSKPVPRKTLPPPTKGSQFRFISSKAIVRGKHYVIDNVEWIPKEQSNFGKDHAQATLKTPDGKRGILALNATTYRVLWSAWGDDPSLWIGKTIVFSDELVDTATGKVQGLVGRPLGAETHEVQPPEKTPPEDEPF